MKRWGGRKAQELTRLCLAEKGIVCRLQLPGCTQLATTADHIVPQSKGGPHELWNLQPACAHCNSSRGNRPIRPRRSLPTRKW